MSDRSCEETEANDEDLKALVLQQRFLEIIDDIESEVVYHHKELVEFLKAQREQIKSLSMRSLQTDE